MPGTDAARSATGSSSRPGEVDPRRRRHRRGHRHGRRVGDHRRVRPGDPRVRRRPQRRSPAAPRVLSDRIVVQITAAPGESFVDRMIALVEGAERQKTPNEIALTILLAALTIIFLLAVVALQPMAGYSGRAAVPGRAHRAAGLPDPDHHRRAAVGHRHRRHGPAGAAQRARHVRPGRRGRRRRRHPAAGQDRHDHLRQPARHRADPGARVSRGGAGRGRPAVQPGRPDPGGPQHRRAVRRGARPAGGGDPRSEATAEFVAFTAQTRMCGLDRRRARPVRKGAGSAVAAWVGARRPARRRSRRPSTGSASRAGRRWSSPSGPSGTRAGARRRRSCPTWSSPAWPSGSPRCARWASAR